MFTKVKAGLTYANVIATLALFLALGGGAYAAIKLPKNSVGSKQIKSNAVNSSKLKDGSLLSKDFRAGQLPAGAQGPVGPRGADGTNGTNGTNGDTGPRGPSDAYYAQETNGGQTTLAVTVPAGDYAASGDGRVTNSNGQSGTTPDGATECNLEAGGDPAAKATTTATVPGTGLSTSNVGGGSASVSLHGSFHLDVEGTITMSCTNSPKSAQSVLKRIRIFPSGE